MIQLIYGPKGSGKTKRLISMANAELDQTSGNVVFIDDDKRYMYDVKPQVRFVNVKEYAIDSEDKLYGFISGLMAGNFDIAAFYLDAFMHITKGGVEKLESFVKKVQGLPGADAIKFVINVSANPEEAPDSLKGYII